MLHFYKLLKIRTSVGLDEKSQSRYKFHKKYLSGIKMIFLVVYIVINPIIDAPKWCIDHYKNMDNFDRWSPTLDCDVMNIPYSKNPTLSPYVISISDFVCLGFFLFFRWYKSTWEKKRPKFKKRNIFLIVAVITVIIDNIFCIYFFVRPFYSIFCRPIVFACFLH